MRNNEEMNITKGDETVSTHLPNSKGLKTRKEMPLEEFLNVYELKTQLFLISKMTNQLHLRVASIS